MQAMFQVLCCMNSLILPHSQRRQVWVGQNLFWFFHSILWKNPNELFG